MVRLSFLFFFFLFFFKTTLAQNEDNIWYFGEKAGLDFNSGTVMSLGNSTMVTDEGCATVCHPNTGNLLFYTSGDTIYNQNHQVMMGGVGLNGNATTTQSAIILRNPGSTSMYTIFTMDFNGGGNLGLQFTQVDMNGNGGLGSVITPINTPVFNNATEKLLAIQHMNGIDYWIVVEDNVTNGFRSFLFNSTGISSTGVLSIPGEIPVAPLGNGGCLKASLSGTKVASAIQFLNKVIVYNFNKSTGEFSSVLGEINIANPYGVEFSPNEQFLYVSPNSNTENLTQYDITLSGSAAIEGSKVQLSTSNLSRGSIQLARDQRIYCTNYGSSMVSIINNPNLAGISCDLVDNGITLASGTFCRFGLPTRRNNFLSESNEKEICLGDSILLFTDEFDSPSWATEDDPTTIISTLDSIKVSPSSTQSFIVFEGSDTVKFIVSVSSPIALDLGPDICVLSGEVTLNATTIGDVTYEWQDGSDSNAFVADETGLYWVEVTKGNCSTRDSINVEIQNLIISSPDIVECDSSATIAINDSSVETGHWVYLGPPGSIGNVIFSPDSLSIEFSATVPVLGDYIFTYINNCGDSISKTTSFISKEPDLTIVSSVQCNFDINLQATNPIQNGQWSVTGPTGATVDIADVNNPVTSATVSTYGDYVFTYTYDFCDASFSHEVKVLSIAPKITTSKTKYICDFEAELTVEVPGQFDGWEVVSGPGILSFSNFEALTTELSVSDYGTYIIKANGCGKSDTIDLTFEKQVPILYAPEYVECGLEAILEYDFEGEAGDWSLTSPTGNNVSIDTSSVNKQAIISTDHYGAVVVTYEACDTAVSRVVNFMCELEVPNVFTPNNDPLNPYFIIERLNDTYYSQSNFTVFNRWGVEIYHNGKYGIHGSWWNGNSDSGEPLNEGVYYYELNLRNKINNKSEVYNGTIHIFR
ncbi:MAG: gliding motility-associated C-terminal domain-containing protein [Flavobacteriales bacterium]